MSSHPKYVLFNGEIVPYEDAKVHVNVPAFKFGLSVFEAIAAYWNADDHQLYIFRLEDHAERLSRSMKIMRMAPQYNAKELEDGVLTLLRADEFREDIAIRQIIYLGGEGHIETVEPVEMAVLGSPTKYGPKPPLHCCVSSWTRLADNVTPPRAKAACNYGNSRLAALEARAGGYDAAILLNDRGKVSEHQTGCVFLVRDGVPVTSPGTSDILESITRATAIELLSDTQGLETEVREVDRTELYIADEAFVGASLSGIRPVLSVDRVPVGKGEGGPIVRMLQRTYYEVHRGTNPLHPEWRTPVY